MSGLAPLPVALETLVELPATYLAALALSQFFIIRLLVHAAAKVVGKTSGEVGGELSVQPKLAVTEVGVKGSAQEAWARHDGRCKYMGLRPEMKPTDEPPKYSLENNENIPLPKLTPAEEEGLEKLYQSLEDLRASKAPVRSDRATLLPFLRARKLNVKVAEAYFRKAVDYRRNTLVVHEMETRWNLEALERVLAPWWPRGGILGHSKKGQVVGYERFGRCRFADVLGQIPMDLMLKLDAVHMQRTIAAMEEDSLRRGQTVIGNSILVLDLDGVGMECLQWKVARAYSKLIETRDMLSPSMLSAVFVIQAPKVFATSWKMFKHLLEPTTQEKVQIVNSRQESLELLRKHIDDDVIPAYLGGGRCTDGDPECQMLLGNADKCPIPQEALEKFQSLLLDEEEKKDAATRDPTTGRRQELPKLKFAEEAACCGCPRRR
mmetsp:Transcript_72330/g.150909  ORF Transcript_72330/g.150909 Transcript_72330/m.150909 type:complete len:435 (+) Transcript_72330:189-1493(+)